MLTGAVPTMQWLFSLYTVSYAQFLNASSSRVFVSADILNDDDGMESLHQDLIDHDCEVDKGFTDLLRSRDREARQRRPNTSMPQH